ncbi:putative quinol monooxygenase [Butyrivibrio sp. INlla16]|uniref:putative quinol monooxygenase n=1 Tax=Butyrivibrio sp. INlla16 TaxID=1520807 RepID=UPI0008865CDB|nr:putative quinol monooxygenase [Butyrivibrio sp. INlla16]SDB62754.1 Quinol monooxygenase YgiN [Butyrivibrio sp. INlla16]
MLKVVARLTVKKDKIDEFKKTAEDLIKKSNAEEANIFYTLNQSVEDEQKFAFIECWRDQVALKAHEATEHFTETFQILGGMTEGSEPVEIYNEIEY